MNETESSLLIRPAELADARDINVLRRTPDLARNLVALPSETILQNEDFISAQLRSPDDHLFCAEISQKNAKRVVGLAGLHVRKPPRKRHSAMLGIIVHSEFQGQGIGQKLMATLIDLADNWLLLKRVDLTVFPDNRTAISLYEKFGFVSEGIAKMAVVRNGVYEDILMMARLNHV